MSLGVSVCASGLDGGQTRCRAGGKGIAGTVSLGVCGQRPGLPGSLTPYGFCPGRGDPAPHWGA